MDVRLDLNMEETTRIFNIHKQKNENTPTTNFFKYSVLKGGDTYKQYFYSVS